MEIVKAEYAHAEQIAKIELEAFSHPWNEIMIKNEIDNPHAVILCAIEKECVLGYIGCQVVLDEVYITNVAVRQDKKGQGISKILLEHIIEYSKKRRASFVTLEVRVSNAVAISLYNKYNFKQVGLRKNYYEDPQEDALLLAYFPTYTEE